MEDGAGGKRLGAGQRERAAARAKGYRMVQDPPYYRQGFQYGLSTEHHLGAVNGLPLDYGIDTRKPWGKQTDRRELW